MARSHIMKTWFVNVFEGYKTVFSKQCNSVDEANQLLKEKKLEYPTSNYSVVKETRFEDDVNH